MKIYLVKTKAYDQCVDATSYTDVKAYSTRQKAVRAKNGIIKMMRIIEKVRSNCKWEDLPFSCIRGKYKIEVEEDCSWMDTTATNLETGEVWHVSGYITLCPKVKKMEVL